MKFEGSNYHSEASTLLALNIFRALVSTGALSFNKKTSRLDREVFNQKTLHFNYEIQYKNKW